MSEVRETQLVELKTRPDLKLYVRALNAVEAIELHSRLGGIDKTPELVAEQLATLVCKQDGTPVFADRAAALEFMKTSRPNVVAKLAKAGTAFNELNDETIEDARKN